MATHQAFSTYATEEEVNHTSAPSRHLKDGVLFASYSKLTQDWPGTWDEQTDAFGVLLHERLDFAIVGLHLSPNNAGVKRQQMNQIQLTLDWLQVDRQNRCHGNDVRGGLIPGGPAGG